MAGAYRHSKQLTRHKRAIGPRARPNSLSRLSKAGVWPLVRNFHAFEYEGDGAGFRRDRRDFDRNDEQERASRIEEATDQPRAGDAVDLRPSPR